jgi:RNA polymerase sigma-70 factor (ECF subfamily)
MGTKVADWPHVINDRSSHDFSVLYNQHVATVRRILSRMVSANDLDDLVQDVFVRIYRFQESFREEADLKTWIHRICVNSVQDHYRKKRWTGILSFGSAGEDEPVASENFAEDLSNQNFVEKALHKLSVKERVVVVLFYLEDSTIEEISASLELPEGTIKSRLHSARSKLQNFMKKEGVQI